MNYNRKKFFYENVKKILEKKVNENKCILRNYKTFDNLAKILKKINFMG